MKQSISSTTMFQLILSFTLLFAAFLALTITYNRAFKMKNEVILILEKYEGKENSIELINNFLTSNGYNTLGNCKNGEVGFDSLNSVTPNRNNNNKSYYCLKSIKDNNSDKVKYEVRLFYRFNLPFVGELLTFSIKGETKKISCYDGCVKQVF